MTPSRRVLPLLAGPVLAVWLLAPAPALAQKRSNYSKTMEEMTGYNSHKGYGRQTRELLLRLLPLAGVAGAGVVVLAVIVLVARKPADDPDAAARTDPWVQAQFRKRRARPRPPMPDQQSVCPIDRGAVPSGGSHTRQDAEPWSPPSAPGDGSGPVPGPR